MKYFKMIAVFVLAVAIFAGVFNYQQHSQAVSARVTETEPEPSFNCDEPIYTVRVYLDPYPVREGEECIYGFDALWRTIRYTEFIEAFLESVDGYQEELGIDWATKTNYELSHDEFMEAYCGLMWKAIGEGSAGEIRNTGSLRAKMSRCSFNIVRRATTEVYPFHYYNEELDRNVYLPVAYVEYVEELFYDEQNHEFGNASVRIFNIKQ